MIPTTIYGHVVTENQILSNQEITIQDGLIQSIAPHPVSTSKKVEPMVILPGFRDQHVHDWIGQSISSSGEEENALERFRSAMRFFARQGATAIYLATFGGPLSELETYCRIARKWMDHPDNGRDGARLLGIHIEGTFLNEECRGAQPAEYCLIPTRDDCIEALNRLHSTGAVKLVNIVPDYGDESLKIIRHATDLGMIVGSGHTKSSADLLRKAYDESSLRFMVHYTNGPTGQSFKPFGGGSAFEGGLNLPLYKELILDRTHIDERYVLDILRRTEERWGLEKAIVITDALFPSPDEIPQGEFTIGSTFAQVDNHRKSLRTTAYLQDDGSRISAPSNTLCGSILTMRQAFSNLVTLFTQSISGHWFDHTALPLEQAIVRAARLCATHQAMLDGSYEDNGSIAVGKKADLVVGTLDRKNDEYEFHVENTYINGTSVF